MLFGICRRRRRGRCRYRRLRSRRQKQEDTYIVHFRWSSCYNVNRFVSDQFSSNLIPVPNSLWANRRRICYQWRNADIFGKCRIHSALGIRILLQEFHEFDSFCSAVAYASISYGHKSCWLWYIPLYSQSDNKREKNTVNWQMPFLRIDFLSHFINWALFTFFLGNLLKIPLSKFIPFFIVSILFRFASDDYNVNEINKLISSARYP